MFDQTNSPRKGKRVRESLENAKGDRIFRGLYRYISELEGTKVYRVLLEGDAHTFLLLIYGSLIPQKMLYLFDINRYRILERFRT